MSNCKYHIVPAYLSDLEQVAKDIADMPYDKVGEFFYHLEKKLSIDSQKDKEGGRIILACNLKKCENQARLMKNQFDIIWKICEPHMF